MKNQTLIKWITGASSVLLFTGFVGFIGYTGKTAASAANTDDPTTTDSTTTPAATADQNEQTSAGLKDQWQKESSNNDPNSNYAASVTTVSPSFTAAKHQDQIAQMKTSKHPTTMSKKSTASSHASKGTSSPQTPAPSTANKKKVHTRTHAS